jgi:ubiquinone/menaquinone biosynthesis C-methylase UbiE
MNKLTKFSQERLISGKIKNDIRQFFDEMSAGRNDTINANPVIFYEQELRAKTVLELLEVKPGERVLDIGCGNARDIASISQSGGQVVGVDISEGMVEAAMREINCIGIRDVILQVGDATCLDFPDDFFDKILCSEVIEHIPDVSRALREMRRVLRPGGSLVLSTPNKGSWYGFERYWIWRKLLGRKWPHPFDEWRNLAEVRSLVEESGFRVCEQRSVCFIPGFVVTYFILPCMLQKLLVFLIRKIEPLLQRWFQYRGYMICVMAMRGNESRVQ